MWMRGAFQTRCLFVVILNFAVKFKSIRKKKVFVTKETAWGSNTFANCQQCLRKDAIFGGFWEHSPGCSTVVASLGF
jgi:hypothetical protein